MNQKNLMVLFHNYIDHFDELNNPEHEEMYKWNAIGELQNNWNLAVDNVSGMLRKSFSDSHTLINNRIVQPVSGLIALAEAEPEFVRNTFMDLLSEDHGDIVNRQRRIMFFVDACNSRIEKHFPDKWKYMQDVRSTIAYLAMIRPQDDYLFKSTAAHHFARYMEYGPDIGVGTSFSLKNYYDMCDQLVEEIRKCPELIEKDAERGTAWKDPSYHVLAYDLIFCMNAYELRDGMKEPPAKGKSTSIQQRIYRKEQSERIQRELEKIQDQIDSINADIDGIEEHDFEGEVLKTRVFGIVRIQRQHENLLYFEVNGQTKSFALPSCISKGFLMHDDLTVVENYKRKQALQEQIKNLDGKQRLKAMELKRYTD